MGNIIKQANARIMEQPVANRDGQCNCSNQDECPLGIKCLTSCTVYTAEVNTDDTEAVYHGSTESEFKTRYNGHLTSFRLRHHEKDTKLSEHIWSLKDSGARYSIKWSVAAQAHPYKCGTRRCDVCLSEKTVIARSKHPCMLNKKSEIMSKCRHRNKFTLDSVLNR